MNNLILHYKNRIHKLTQKDPVMNQHIIAKLYRKIRAIENN